MKMTRMQIRIAALCVFAVAAVVIAVSFRAALDDEDLVSIDDVPEAARAVILKAAAEGRLVKVERTTKKDREVYAAEIVAGDQEIELAVAPNGDIVHREAEDRRSSGVAEEMISLDEAPEAVQATILKEAKGTKVDELEKKLKKGKIIYAAEFLFDGKLVELWVDPDGKVVSKEVGEPDE